MFKNMKIEVNNDLDEIVAELQRLGFRPWCVEYVGVSIVLTNKKGLYTTFHKDICDIELPTTLAELKEM